MFKIYMTVAMMCIGLLAGSVTYAANATSTVKTTTVTATSTITTMVVATSTATTTTIVTASTTPIIDRAVVEKRVEDYFAATPVMIDIARCESNFRQYSDSGKPFHGGNDGGMVGVFQFYEKIHSGAALALGFDLTTLEGNLGYAKHVYASEGTTPWVSCVPVATPIVVVSSDAQTKLKIDLMTKLVGLLQELLKLELAAKAK